METPPSSSTRRRRKKRKAAGISPQVLFAVLAALAVAAMGAAYLLPPPFLAVSAVSCVLIGWALYVNDHAGFSRSKELRRAGEPRRHFNLFEVFVLMGLIFAEVFVAVYVLMMR